MDLRAMSFVQFVANILLTSLFFKAFKYTPEMLVYLGG